MKHLFKPDTIKNIIIVFILFVVVKALWVLVEFLWLPSSGLEHVEEKGNKALYYRVKLTAHKVIEKKKKLKNKPVGNIKNIKLLAIYNASDTTVITVEYKSKTQVLSKGEDINGFVLESASSDFASFSKNGKIYEILLESIKKKSTGSSAKKQPVEEKRKSKKAQSVVPEGEIVDAGDHKIIDQSIFDHYTNNMDAIYENIGITEIKEGENIKGFSISFVKKNSLFSKLGVLRGDVIKSVNGQEITSYNAAFGIFKSIKDVENLTLVIERGKKEMELEYEIN